MQWLNSLSIRNKILVGSYSIVILFSIATLAVTMIAGASLYVSLFIIIALAAVTYPISSMIEKKPLPDP